MTRKDFELIAWALLDARAAALLDAQAAVTSSDAEMTRERLSAIDTVAELIASELAKTNPRFDRERFLAACGVVEG